MDLLKRGHYNSAMIHYAGEWYWGVDRLHHLAVRLDELGLARSGGSEAHQRIAQIRSRLDLLQHLSKRVD